MCQLVLWVLDMVLDSLVRLHVRDWGCLWGCCCTASSRKQSSQPFFAAGSWPAPGVSSQPDHHTSVTACGTAISRLTEPGGLTMRSLLLLRSASSWSEQHISCAVDYVLAEVFNNGMVQGSLVNDEFL